MTGRPRLVGSSVHGHGRQDTGRREHQRVGRRSRRPAERAGGRRAGRRRLVTSAPDGPGERVGQVGRRHVEAGEQAAEQGVERLARAEVVRRRARASVTTSATTRSAVTTCATRARSTSRCLEVRERHRVVVRPGAARPPRALADPLPELGLARRRPRASPPPWPRACASSARSAGDCSSCGTRTGCTRLASIRARSDHSKSTSGDRERLATRSPRTASRARARSPSSAGRGSRTSSATRAGRPGPAVGVAGRPPVAAALGQRRAHVAVAQSYGERRVLGTRTARSRWLRLLMVTAPQHHQRGVEPDVDRPPGQLQRIELGARSSPWCTRDGRVRPSRTSAPWTSASALSRKAGRPGRGRSGREPRGPPRALGRVRASAAAGDGELGLARRCWSRWLPNVRAASSRAAGRCGSARQPSAPRPGPGCRWRTPTGLSRRVGQHRVPCGRARDTRSPR